MQNCYGQNASEQTERLTTKHIHTLKFLQEIVAENKELKERIDQLEGKDHVKASAEDTQNRIQEIQEEYLRRADEINTLLTAKHQAEMMKKVEEQLLAETKWANEKAELLAEIEKLKKENEELQNRLVSEETSQKAHVKIFELKVAALQEEISRLTEELSSAESRLKQSADTARRLAKSEAENRSLRDELSAANQHSEELEYKIRRLERELNEAGDRDENEKVLSALKSKLAKLHKERGESEARQREAEQKLEELLAENSRLRRALDDSERMRLDMKSALDELMLELAALKRQVGSGADRQTFKEFIQVKRELAAVKEENEALRLKLKFGRGGNKELLYPSLKSKDLKPQVRPGSGDHIASGRRKEAVLRGAQLGIVGNK